MRCFCLLLLLLLLLAAVEEAGAAAAACGCGLLAAVDGEERGGAFALLLVVETAFE